MSNVISLNPKPKEDNYPFWRNPNKILTKKLVSFLAEKGFSQFQSDESRLSKTLLIKNDNGVLQIHSEESVKGWLVSEVSKDNDLEIEDKDTILDTLIRTTTGSLQNWLGSLPRVSSNDYPDTKLLKMFKDDADNCYIIFSSGVVHITKDNIELISRNKISDKGNIWETAVIKHDIKIEDKISNSSPFPDFCKYAMKRGVKPLSSNNDINEGTDNEEYKSSLESFETGFGYLIHNYVPPQEQRVVVFVDVNSSPTRTEGGNGKSAIMKSMKYYRPYAFIDGEQFRPSSDDASRFNFSSVRPDTGFVLINDLKKNFDLRQMYSAISDDFVIEGKNRNKHTIQEEDKPKFGITTNFTIRGLGNSYERRQHIVEFGDFFNVAKNNNIEVAEVIGKNMFDKEFTKEDWDAFYNYGFRCVQKYLKYGLVESQNTNYKRKNVIQTIEGVGGDGTILKWIDDFLKTTLIKHNFHETGIAKDELFALFMQDNPDYVKKGWDDEKFHDTFFDYIMHLPNYDYNHHKSRNGDTRTARRWRIGKRGMQKDFIKILISK